MRIEWINHASYLLDAGGTRVVVDPWLEGTAFDDGWKLLAPTQFRYEDFEKVDYVWFSHEHPDHFSPPNLKKIPESLRRRITILYQPTQDGRVLEFCRSLGFARTVELPPHAWFSCGPNLELMCGPFPAQDSWLAARSHGELVLNLNDCVVRTSRQARTIRDLIGARPNVLLTQFSYATWYGNREEGAKRRRAALEKLQQMGTQIATLEPRYVIPFASFIGFCHEENFHCNDEVNRIRVVHDFLATLPDVRPVVLHPGESWEIGASHSSEQSMAAYDADYARLDASPEKLRSKAVAPQDLMAQGRAFVERILRHNGRAMLGLRWSLGRLPPAHIFVSDHGEAYRLSVSEGLTPVSSRAEECDIELSSEALSYCLRFPWGGGTIAVSSRFRIPSAGKRSRFERYAHLSNTTLPAVTLGSVAGGVRRSLSARWQGSKPEGARASSRPS